MSSREPLCACALQYPCDSSYNYTCSWARITLYFIVSLLVQYSGAHEQYLAMRQEYKTEPMSQSTCTTRTMMTQPLKPTLTVSLVALFLLKCVHAHVVLTFPPARNPKYDYLDNYREGGPCGVPGKSVKLLKFRQIEHWTLWLHLIWIFSCRVVV